MSEESIPEPVRDLAAGLALPRPMRRGSVSERAMKCGQRECRCQSDPEARHGPYFSLTRAEGGKTKSRYLSAEAAALAREQIEDGRSFRERVESYWEACERWADQRLDAVGATDTQAAKKKKPSARRSKARSTRRSRRS